MERDFPPRWLSPNWVMPLTEYVPYSLRHAAYFSLYAPFILLLIGVILTCSHHAFPMWTRITVITYAVVFRVTIAAAFVVGAIAFCHGIRRRLVEIYAIAFWGCLFNGVFLLLITLSLLVRSSSLAFL